MKTDFTKTGSDTLQSGQIKTVQTPSILSHLARYAPAGFPLSQEIKIYLTAFGISVLYSFGFIIRYLNARAELFEITITGQKILITGAKMPEMTALIHDAFLGFFLMILLAGAGIVYHYLFHKQGSKSIYLMRRLPNPFELHKRCITLPLLGIILSLLAALLLFLLYYGIYIIFTPSICLTKVSLTIIRSVIL